MKKRTWKLLLLAVVVLSSALGATVLLSSGEDRISQPIPARYGVEDPQFVRTMGTLLGPPLVGGNRVTILTNGDEIFPAMLKAIAEAEKSVNFETYIYWSGQIGRKFSEALSKKAREGVETHVLVDWVGAAKMERELFESMRAAGVQVEYYRPLHWYTLSRMNNRTHRKLLVVDGKVGFTGGVGIADEWLGNAEGPDNWRDSHFRVEGPAVAQMQAAFLDNWIGTQSKVLDGNAYFPELSPAGDQYAQVFKSSAREGSDSVRLMYMLSIAAARKSIHMQNAYFVPDDLSVRMFVQARKRDVEVHIIVPGDITDQQLVGKASRALWGDLLRAGVKIYRYKPTMMHCKIFVVDGLWTSVGSTNFDNRSFRLNDEANLNVLDAGFARENLVQFERDKARSKAFSLADWENRGAREKFSDWVASWFRVQL